MNVEEKTYIAIDLKSFYASVECAERNLDPMNTNLVVADAGRTEKTICLAVSPALKAYGIPGRPRLFEVVQRVREVNAERSMRAPYGKLRDNSVFADELSKDASLAVDYIVAPPQMAHYMNVSARIYEIYLKYIAPEDIHVYSIDEVFIDAGGYLSMYGVTARELAMKMILDILKETGITATAGIGTNLYLCKVAMDIGAKHIPADENGVRIAELDEISYRRTLWDHRPITDFWRVGRGYARRLAEYGMFTMGDVARCSLGKPGEYYSEELLFDLFGVNAELLIDHAWGRETCGMRDIKSYKPENMSLGSGQVLQSPYTNDKARLVVKEMADMLALDLTDKGLVTDLVVLTVGYDKENIGDEYQDYQGETKTDMYGRKIPKHAHGTENLGKYTSSSRKLTEAFDRLFERITDRRLTVRRLSIEACHVISEQELKKMPDFRQTELFREDEIYERERIETEELLREKELQNTMLKLKRRFGKNAVLKGMNLEDGATARNRNEQIGGHRAGSGSYEKL